MNKFQTNLYQQLQNLVASNEAFFAKDQQLDDKIYRVFNYRLASFSDFCLPGAREARGIMFEVDTDGNPIRLACFMPSKFFNLNENPFTMNLDLSDDNIDGVMDKLDGSIISTFMHGDKLMLKSKTSLFSDHVAQATEWLNANSYFKEKLDYFTRKGYSVHMELTSPNLRIVLGYPEVKLTILAMRRNEDGVLVTKRNFYDFFDYEFRDDGTFYYWVQEYDPVFFDVNPFTQPITFKQLAGLDDSKDKVSKFIDNIKSMTGVEGYIVRLKNGEHIKIKCDWYCALHHTKDSISAPRRLFECIINEGVDDLKGMFSEDPITIERITTMEAKVVKIFNHMISTVEDFYNTNKELDRKSYAIAAQKVDDGLMGLKMNAYLGKANDYKAFAVKHPERFGINANEVYEMVDE